MDVSIIYVNYKTSHLIVNSINSVKEKTEEVDYEIIIIDNNSGDNSLERIKKVHSDVLCISSAENAGFGKANNLGYKQAKGRYVFFLNPDTLLINNAIKQLKDFLENNPSYGACGGNLYDENGFPTMSFSRKFPSLLIEFASIFYINIPVFPYPKSTCHNYSNKILDVAFISGADLMVKRSVLDKVGAFSDAFFMNFEETELCYRISKNGYGIGALPYAKIIHLEGKSDYVKQSRLSFFYDGQLTYFYKRKPLGAIVIYSIVQAKNTIRLFQFTLLGNKKKMEYWNTKRQVYRQTFTSFKNRMLTQQQ